MRGQLGQQHFGQRALARGGRPGDAQDGPARPAGQRRPRAAPAAGPPDPSALGQHRDSTSVRLRGRYDPPPSCVGASAGPGQPWRVGQQLRGVPAGRLGQDLPGRPGLDDLTVPQHHRGLRHAAHQGQVVRDEDHGQLALGRRGPEQLHDDRLHRDVQRRGDLVADQHVRLGDQGAGDRDPLPLAAGQLIRDSGTGSCPPSATSSQHLGDPVGLLAAGQAEEALHRLGHDLADGLPRVERGIRVLEHVLDLPQHLPRDGAGRPGPAARRAASPRRSSPAAARRCSGPAWSCPSRTRRPRRRSPARAGPGRCRTAPARRGSGPRRRGPRAARPARARPPQPGGRGRSGPAALTSAARQAAHGMGDG